MDFARAVLVFALIGLGATEVAQSVFQRQFAAMTLWGTSLGWQSENAIMGLGMVLILLPLLREEARARAALPGLFVMSLLLCANHFWASLNSQQGLLVGNLAGAGVNGVVALICLIYWK